jgi:hypothetical protein
LTIQSLERLAGQLSNSDRTPLRRAIEAYRRLDLSRVPVVSTPTRAVRRATRLGPNQLDRLVERHESGAQMVELAAEFGIDRRTISHHLRKRGVALRPYPPTDSQVDEMVRRYESGLPLRLWAAAC